MSQHQTIALEGSLHSLFTAYTGTMPNTGPEKATTIRCSEAADNKRFLPPQTFPLESVWLAGEPLTLKVQAVAGAAWVSILNDQVQVPEAQTRFMFSIVHCGCAAAIIETAPDWRSTRASTASAFGAGAARATLERMAVTIALENFILKACDLLLRWKFDG